MKKFVLGVIVLIIFITVISSILLQQNISSPPSAVQPTLTSNNTSQNNEEAPAIEVIAEGLDTPWAIAFLPDKRLLVTERNGTVRLIDSKGSLSSTPVATIPSVQEIGEGGLMGIALHPSFASNNYVYLYYTYSSAGANTLNRVVRMKFENAHLINEEIIVDRIPGAANHNGGRIKFGPDTYLYIATGDAQEPSLSQSRENLAGKILRVTDTGDPAPGNPFNTRVYSYGHRNPQGLAWDSQNRLWSTEHGPSGGTLGRGNDEVNQIQSGKNYGWPSIQGDQTAQGMERPFVHSGVNTWAPAGLAVIGDAIYFGGLRGEALYEVSFNGGSVQSYFEGVYGRIREVIAGPDGMLYITTSNQDGRGSPQNGDDKIMRVNPQKI